MSFLLCFVLLIVAHLSSVNAIYACNGTIRHEKVDLDCKDTDHRGTFIHEGPLFLLTTNEKMPERHNVCRAKSVVWDCIFHFFQADTCSYHETDISRPYRDCIAQPTNHAECKCGWFRANHRTYILKSVTEESLYYDWITGAYRRISTDSLIEPGLIQDTRPKIDCHGSDSLICRFYKTGTEVTADCSKGATYRLVKRLPDSCDGFNTYVTAHNMLVSVELDLKITSRIRSDVPPSVRFLSRKVDEHDSLECERRIRLFNEDRWMDPHECRILGIREHARCKPLIGQSMAIVQPCQQAAYVPSIKEEEKIEELILTDPVYQKHVDRSRFEFKFPDWYRYLLFLILSLVFIAIAVLVVFNYIVIRRGRTPERERTVYFKRLDKNEPHNPDEVKNFISTP